MTLWLRHAEILQPAALQPPCVLCLPTTGAVINVVLRRTKAAPPHIKPANNSSHARCRWQQRHSASPLTQHKKSSAAPRASNSTGCPRCHERSIACTGMHSLLGSQWGQSHRSIAIAKCASLSEAAESERQRPAAHIAVTACTRSASTACAVAAALHRHRPDASCCSDTNCCWQAQAMFKMVHWRYAAAQHGLFRTPRRVTTISVAVHHGCLSGVAPLWAAAQHMLEEI